MKINNCRSCGSNKLVNCLNLGKQALTGIFPKNKNQKITSGNLSLLFCNNCNLLQLSENFNRNQMYGINYGQVIRGRMSAATSAAVGRAKTVSSSVAGARGRASAATRSGLGRAKSAASSVAKAPGRVSRSIAKNPKRKILFFRG